MESILQIFRLLGDPTRVRLSVALRREELTVAELQSILAMGQSTISTHLGQLKRAGLVEDRRSGKSVLYRWAVKGGDIGRWVDDCLERAGREIPETGRDRQALDLVLKRRQDRMRAYFDELAGKFGRHYVPGRSWKGLAETLLKLMPPLVIADLGAGEGTFSQLLAQRAERVIAVDNSEKMVEVGTELAREHGVANLEYRLGDMEQLPIADDSVDLAFFSQSLHHAPHPERAIGEAWRIVKPAGRIAVLDLLRHHFEEARELYADLWLGFTEVELVGYLEGAGFRNVECAIVHREEQAPHLETLLAVADK